LDISHTLKKSVQNAQRLSVLKPHRQNFAQTRAGQHGEETKRLTTSIDHVKSAGFHLVSIVTIQQRHAGHAEVFDLHVEGEHEYYANGVLVHNCIDGWRYWCLENLMHPFSGSYSLI
jgi:hypothetical protein